MGNYRVSTPQSAPRFVGIGASPQAPAAGSAASYHLQLSTASDFATLAYEAQGLTEQSHAYPDTLVAETTYHWRVEACDAQDTCSAWSQARSFTTGTGGSEVAAPMLTNPEDGSYIGPTTAVTLEWNAVSGATRYEVQVAEDGDFTGAPTDEATTTAYTATGLTVQAAYGWRVKACADLTCSTWSVAWTFRTEALEITRYYYLRDHLGSVRATVNEEGTVVHHDDYYPFGLQMPQRSMETPEAPTERYTGHELEAETGLLYAGARYYDPVLGRWPSREPLVDDDPRQLLQNGTGVLLSTSPYNYSLNNPINLRDPDGKCPICVTAGVGAVVGGTVSAGVAIYQGKSARDVLKATAAGAVGGAVIGSGVGLISATGVGGLGAVGITAGSGAVAGAASSGVSQGLNIWDGSQETFSFSELGTDAAIGSGANLFGSLIARGVIQPAVEGVISQAALKRSAALSGRGLKSFKRSIRKELTRLGYSKAYVKQGVKEAVEALKSTSQTELDVITVSVTTSGQVTIETVTQSVSNELDEIDDENR